MAQGAYLKLFPSLLQRAGRRGWAGRFACCYARDAMLKHDRTRFVRAPVGVVGSRVVRGRGRLHTLETDARTWHGRALTSSRARSRASARTRGERVHADGLAPASPHNGPVRSVVWTRGLRRALCGDGRTILAWSLARGCALFNVAPVCTHAGGDRRRNLARCRVNVQARGPGERSLAHGRVRGRASVTEASVCTLPCRDGWVRADMNTHPQSTASAPCPRPPSNSRRALPPPFPEFSNLLDSLPRMVRNATLDLLSDDVRQLRRATVGGNHDLERPVPDFRPEIEVARCRNVSVVRRCLVAAGP